MDIFCKVCDRSILENESEQENYLATLRKKKDKSLHKKCTINKVNLEEFDKILNDYVTTHNKNIDFYFIYCEFVIEFDNNFTANTKTSYFYKVDITNIKRHFLYDIYYFKAGWQFFCNINQMTIKTISDRCNKTYELYMNQPMQSVELVLNMVVAKNPQSINSLDQNKNHLLSENILLYQLMTNKCI